MYCWSLAWRILSITLLACEMSAIVWQFKHSLASPFFGIGMKTDLFQSCGHCWVFQICLHIECSTFTASPFRIWNSSTGIPSPPLALFVVMLSKAHLTSHSRMSGSRWVTTQFYFLLVPGCSFWDCGSRACHPPWKTFKGSRLSRLSDGARVGPLLCSPFLSYRLTSAASTTHDMTRS